RPAWDLPILLHYSSLDEGNYSSDKRVSSMEATSAERIPQMKGASAVPKLAWGLVVAEGLIMIGYGLVFSTGIDIVFHNGPASAYSAQATNDLVRATQLIGVLLILGGILVFALGWKAFRGGDKWAWYTIAALPIISVIIADVDYLGNGALVPTVWASFFSLGFFPLLSLLISIRSFFPKEKTTYS
ncbi:MAG: hypothetical protein KGI38_12895, partial [Thaumarchaeota archaeon]|nr:hypothetical protein [Nitrososphaerota archaeon]